MDEISDGSNSQISKPWFFLIAFCLKTYFCFVFWGWFCKAFCKKWRTKKVFTIWNLMKNFRWMNDRIVMAKFSMDKKWITVSVKHFKWMSKLCNQMQKWVRVRKFAKLYLSPKMFFFLKKILLKFQFPHFFHQIKIFF